VQVNFKILSKITLQELFTYRETSAANYTAGSNKTIIGLPGATTGSWTFKGSSNVILRNLKIRGNGADGDAVTVTDYSHHIWFDHLDLADSTDENLSIKRGSDYITISWCKYWFSRDGGHTFGGLIGHSDNNAAQDEGRLRVTYHHNWYSKGVTERMPRVRFGKVHIFNNLFDAPGNNYVIRCGYKANIRSEGNVFVNMKIALTLALLLRTPYSRALMICL